MTALLTHCIDVYRVPDGTDAMGGELAPTELIRGGVAANVQFLKADDAEHAGRRAARYPVKVFTDENLLLTERNVLKHTDESGGEWAIRVTSFRDMGGRGLMWVADGFAVGWQ